MAQTIYVLNGPNMNLPGTREPEKNSRTTLTDVEKLCRATAERFGFAIEFRQSNVEGELVNWIQEAHAKKAAGLVINPSAGAPSVAIRDALAAMQIPVSEIHVANIHRHESFGQDSHLSQATKAVICGFGIDGYALAISGLAGVLGSKEKH